jgi:hypothetical protein
MGKENGRRSVHACGCSDCQRHPYGGVAKEHRVINRVVVAANEHERRLFVALLARQEGRGGVALLRRITGLSRTTIVRGMRELEKGGGVMRTRIRRAGGGRKRVEKKVPRSWRHWRTS